MIAVKLSLSQYDCNGLTLQEIASMMDLTKERVRQIEARALAKLKRRLLAEQLNPSNLYGE